MGIALIVALACLVLLALVRGGDSLRGRRLLASPRDALDRATDAFYAQMRQLFAQVYSALARDLLPRALHALTYTALVLVRSTERRLISRLTALRHLRRRAPRTPQSEAQHG